MNINANNISTFGFNQFGMKSKEINGKQQSTIEKIQNNIKQRNDILEISKEGKMKLKLRNLKQVEKLEGKKEEVEKGLEAKLKLYESVAGILEDVQKIIKESMNEDISTEEKEEMQSELEDKLEGIEDIVNKAIENGNKGMEKLNDEELKGVDGIDEINKEIDMDKEVKESKEQEKENRGKIDFKDIDILKDPLKASLMIGFALESVNEEIAKLQEELSKLEKNMDKLLGKDVEKETIKNMNNIDEDNKVEENKESNVQVSETNNE
ncbi:MAG: hypothetical protein N4A57_08360 [Anaeromicrobium sp.]|jgi:hypothetical protein|uniref:hypothetical protein n=1 Tax=Anaeromicrobium sp. TaxID=1929132 RepID=UPI0025E651C1|nr:hypothetical protein [Anaeromicrobium sp.]MCT4594265.1 hypothetical protein [Anaeromicrobium sp.]